MVINYYGKVVIGDITNQAAQLNDKEEITAENIMVVLYSDCQQLMIWLPNDRKLYNNIVIQTISKEEEIYNQFIDDVISGSVKIVIDTLFISPGHFEILISTLSGVAHKIQFQKLNEGEKEAEIKAEPIIIDHNKPPIVYRDGFGNIIKEDNERWREVYY